jgi:hypothetical protein
VGFFSRLMSSNDHPSEHDLELIYTRLYERILIMSPAEARLNFKEELVCVKDIIARHGNFVVSEGYGSLLVSNRHSNPKVGAHLSKIEAEGVREADIIWFWNMSNLERLFLMRISEVCFGACFLAGMRQGLTSEQAGLQTRKTHPFFGDPDDTSVASGVDRPIPVELKDRVNIFIERRLHEDSQKYFALMDRSSSFNAIIRQAIKAGWL